MLIKNECYGDNLEKSQKFLYMLFTAEGQTDRVTGVIKRISQLWYAIKNALHIYRSPAKFLALFQTMEPIFHYSLSGQHRYTCGPLADANALISESPEFKFHAECQSL